jgi:hypothetical protein
LVSHLKVGAAAIRADKHRYGDRCARTVGRSRTGGAVSRDCRERVCRHSRYGEDFDPTLAQLFARDIRWTVRVSAKSRERERVYRGTVIATASAAGGVLCRRAGSSS